MGSLGNTTRCDRDMLGPKTPEQSQPGSFMPEETRMSLGTILLIILIIVLIGALPTWPYSGGWGYYPSGGVGLVVVILLILLLLGRI
jgi:hypothetical protein